MQRALAIVVCFAAVAACGGDDKPAGTEAAGEAAKEQTPEKQAEATTPENYHVKWQRCQAFFNARDERKLAECFTEDAEVRVAGLDAIVGRDAIVAADRKLWDEAPDYSQNTLASWVAGNTGVFLLQLSAAPKAEPKIRELALYVADLTEDWKIAKATLYVDEMRDAPRDDAFELRDHVGAAASETDSAAATAAAAYATAFNANKPDELVKLFAGDASIFHPALRKIARGTDAIRTAHDQMLAVPATRLETVRTIAIGEWVIAERIRTGKPGGIAIRSPIAQLMQVKDGMIAGLWHFENRVVAGVQLTASPRDVPGADTP